MKAKMTLADDVSLEIYFEKIGKLRKMMVGIAQQVEAEFSPIPYMKKTVPAHFSSPGPSLVCI